MLYEAEVSRVAIDGMWMVRQYYGPGVTNDPAIERGCGDICRISQVELDVGFQRANNSHDIDMNSFEGNLV
jgi:hypothetical protein